MPPSTQYKCFKCSCDLSSNYSLKRHLKSIHDLSDDEIDQQIQTIQRIPCHICQDHKVASRMELIDHLNSVHSFNVRVEKEEFNTRQGTRTHVWCEIRNLSTRLVTCLLFPLFRIRQVEGQNSIGNRNHLGHLQSQRTRKQNLLPMQPQWQNWDQTKGKETRLQGRTDRQDGHRMCIASDSDHQGRQISCCLLFDTHVASGRITCRQTNGRNIQKSRSKSVGDGQL